MEHFYRSYNSINYQLLNLIPTGDNKILDLGCATGRFGQELLRRGKAAEIVGVEIYGPSADEAEKFYDMVYRGNIEDIELPYQDYFDFAVCGDILEHLRDPWAIVAKIGRCLATNGLLIVSMPNIRYWRILRDLLIHGKWEYVEAGKGILDITHFRFFTRASCLKMIEGDHFQIVHQEMVILGRIHNFFNKLTLRIFEELLGSRILVIARKK